jgi:capsular exopolysaccharide synthesis family protein
MSRIHEALKKAAQERMAQPGHPPVSDVIDLATGGTAAQTTSDNREDLRVQPAFTTAGDMWGSKFEDFARRCVRPSWKLESRSSIFSGDKGARVISERFRTLRSRLYQIAEIQPLRSLLITSSLPVEGKTFIANNLAQSIVRQSDRRVLLIDADLRASRLHVPLGAPGKPGLADYLRGEANEFQITQVGPDGNLCLIPGGASVADPIGLLHSGKMKLLLEKMSRLFDWVIVDSPPAVAVHDASILADMCDGVIFVVRAGSTDFEVAQKASLEFSNKKLIGVVLNGVAKEDSYGDYYYGYEKEDGEELKKELID